MGLKDILVHVDDRDSNAGRVAAALSLAECHEAHVTGLYVMAKPYLPAYAEVQIDPKIMEMQREQATKAAAVAKQAFEKTAGTSTAVAEWRQAEGDWGELLGLHGRYADMIVVSQNTAQMMFQPDDMPDRLILDAGRPVLVMPAEGKVDSIGRKVLVAWDGSAPAARAVHDAMPLLKLAEAVTVASVDPKSKPNLSGELSAADLAHHLARHGVKVASEHTPRAGSVAETLAKRAKELGCDLIVMGAYGHFRMTELVLGGATKAMLDAASMPVLMSH